MQVASCLKEDEPGCRNPENSERPGEMRLLKLCYLNHRVCAEPHHPQTTLASSYCKSELSGSCCGSASSMLTRAAAWLK